MSIKDIRHEYQRLADKGVLRPEQVNRATLANILEAGAVAFHKGYFGAREWAKVADDARAARHAGDEANAHLVESLATDIAPVTRALRETHTTTDFPLVLSQIRDRVRRQSYNPIEGPLFQSALPVRTATDFKPLRGVRSDTFRRLEKRPEGTNVQYGTVGSSEDVYRVVNYEKAVAFTWEAWVNDDVGEFTQVLFNLGVAARRTRALVLLEAIRDALTRVTPSGTFDGFAAGAGGPTPGNIRWAYERFAIATNANGDPIDRALTHIAVPTHWAPTAANSLESENVVLAGDTDVIRASRNPARGLAEAWTERLMREVFNADGTPRPHDWLAFDNTVRWVEFAALAGFEAGPMTYTKLPDVQEHVEQGSFDNHSLAVKVGDTVGAAVTDQTAVVRVAGA